MLTKTENYKDLLLWGQRALDRLGEREARVNAERILEEVSGLERTQLLLNAAVAADEGVCKKFRSLIELRKQRIPLGYVLGKASFWNEELEVGEGCLIPRPETELIIEKFREVSGFTTEDVFSVLDLGSGSGAIGIAILREYERAQASFLDISERALDQVHRNLDSYQLSNRAEVIHSDVFSACEGRQWDVILSNPPYLAHQDWSALEPEVMCEPREALDGGADGLEFYRKISADAGKHLKSKGLLMFEVGANQSQRVAEVLSANHFKDIKIFKDLAGIERVVLGRR